MLFTSQCATHGYSALFALLPHRLMERQSSMSLHRFLNGWQLYLSCFRTHLKATNRIDLGGDVSNEPAVSDLGWYLWIQEW